MSVTIPCLGVTMVYFYSCCVKRRVGQLEERVGILENRRPFVSAQQTPLAIPSQEPVIVTVPYNPPYTQSYGPYVPYPSAPPGKQYV
jgi:hypothetical protein